MDKRGWGIPFGDKFRSAKKNEWGTNRSGIGDKATREQGLGKQADKEIDVMETELFRRNKEGTIREVGIRSKKRGQDELKSLFLHFARNEWGMRIENSERRESGEHWRKQQEDIR